MIGQHWRQRRDDGSLDRTDVRYDGALLEPQSDRAPDRVIGAHGRAENDAISAAHGASQVIGDDVAKPQGFRALQNPDGSVGKNDPPYRMPVAGGAGDR